MLKQSNIILSKTPMNNDIKKIIEKFCKDRNSILLNLIEGKETKIVDINGKRFYLNDEELEVVDMFFGYHTEKRDERLGKILIYKNL